MAAATDELILLERVFLCLGSADTDEQLQASVCKFLPPVLLKLSSPQEGVRKKVMGLLIHINRRVKSRPKVQLPVEALLLQYQDPAASSFVINFTIIYIKLGYPRMEMKKQAELVPSVLNAIDGKPLSHQDSLLLVIMPALGQIQIPMDAEKRAALIGLPDKLQVAKHLLNFLLDMLLLPYGSVGQMDGQEPGQSIDWTQFPVPPGLSEYAFKRVVGESPPSAEQLEQIKLGIVKFIGGGVFPDMDVLIHLIVAAADTRFSVANAADLELKKIVSGLDWGLRQLAMPLYTLFLGTGALGTRKDVKADMKRVPANTRIRLKLMYYLCRVSKAGFIIPTCIHVVFESLYGNNTNRKLKSLALEFTLNMVQQCSLAPLVRVAGVLLEGMIKLISEGEREHEAMGYTIIGKMGLKIPSLVNQDLSLLQRFFEALVTSEPELRRNIRDALITMCSAFVLSRENENGIEMMNTLLSVHIESPEPSVRSVAGHYAATVFPTDHAPSRYLLLLASGDEKNEISVEALNSLYGTTDKNDLEKNGGKMYFLPDFAQLVTYINKRMAIRIERPASEKFSVGKTTLPYNVTTFKEIITYLRLCLAKSAEIAPQARPLEHPCEETPIVGRYLAKLFDEQPKALNDYLDIIMLFNRATADPVSLNALLEVVGTIPTCMTERYVQELPWLRSLLTSTKVDIRQLAAKIHAIIVVHGCDTNEFESRATEFLGTTKHQILETQHGALVALCWMFERTLTIRRSTDEKDVLLNWKTYISTVETLWSFLTGSTVLMIDAAAQGLGIIGKTFALPIPDAGDDKRPNKKIIVDTLFSIITNVKMDHKVKEKATLALGQLCIGENFPHTKSVAVKLIGLAKETKDVTVHLSIAESLVLCVQGQASPEARDMWKSLPSQHEIPYSQESDELLTYIIDELLKLSRDPHPNSRQAVCIWLLAIVKHNAKRQQIVSRLREIQSVFMDLLSENSDIIQDVASKGLGLVYDSSAANGRDELLSGLLGQFSQGKRSVNQVTPNTKLFEEGELGKSPTGGNISTHREICSLASDLNQPDLVYRFLHLAHHNAVWTSKKGAALGFSAIANHASDDLTKNLSSIVPKLYRYQFDPTPKIQQSMARIWHRIVPSTQKVLEQYHEEILDDLDANLTNNEWRVRNSCCLALADLLKSSAPIDLAKRAPKLWTELFRVMDDCHEDTRLAATTTTKVLSKICIRQCDPSHGKSGELVLQAILPVLLDIGITHHVPTVRSISLQTVSQLVTIAGSMLKPSLVTLIPALLSVTDMESPKLTYMSTMYGAQSEVQEAIDSVRASAAKSHHATETITKCSQYVDGPILKDLMPKVIELLKSSIGLGTKVAVSHFLILLCNHLKQELQPFAGKVLPALASGLMDRNAAVRKTNAVTIGHIVGSAKQASLDKLFNNLNTWYMEKEDDSIRLAIGQALQSINNHNNDVMMKYSETLVPLTFFAMHAEKVPGNENTIELWTDLWGEIGHGTESGIRQHLASITNTLKSALESASWTMKAQGANAVSTVALKLGSTMDEDARNSLLTILTNALQGRTWNGKERVVQALATLSCNSKEALNKDPSLTATVLDALYKESKKESVEYRRHGVKAFADVLHALGVDRFTQLYDIAQEILIKLSSKNDDDDDDDDDDDHHHRATSESTKRREDKLKLQETVYEALGKAWPSSRESKNTQDKYCIQFVTHCNQTLPNTTRPVQVAILMALNLFVDKLVLLMLNVEETSEKDKALLETICQTLNQILRHSIGISKYTKIRKEALNIILSLSKKLEDTGNTKQLENLATFFKEVLPDLSQDHQPEVRTRVVDIKATLKI